MYKYTEKWLLSMPNNHVVSKQKCIDYTEKMTIKLAKQPCCIQTKMYIQNHKWSFYILFGLLFGAIHPKVHVSFCFTLLIKYSSTQASFSYIIICRWHFFGNTYTCKDRVASLNLHGCSSHNTDLHVHYQSKYFEP